MGPPALSGGADRRDPGGVRTGSLIVVLAALLLACGAQASGIDLAQPSRAHPFHGTGSWVSIYDTRAWRNPERVIETLSAHHVRTLYLETSNDRQKVDVV